MGREWWFSARGDGRFRLLRMTLYESGMALGEDIASAGPSLLEDLAAAGAIFLTEEDVRYARAVARQRGREEA